MSKLVTLVLDDNIMAQIEVSADGYKNNSPGGTGGTIKLREQLDPLIKIAEHIVDQIKNLSPDETELSFGIKVGGEGNALCFAKVGAEAQFNVKLTWTRPH